ncbi:S1 family peptidase [Stackebrandtia nassauensis]|uniref:Peptidase S1 and S6 chymotrypsin/Hap n=1 Tax=Stackebrandtia nassauensis (strain DSM 44728 / CIP 108903 / NRRL B-16338 / NBRC 102104 / LLR-40K-21) TaxID=446470 RepID=D3Q615_STANL|nr:serine protease [Stackebrandtia nassauensis]ADD40314.1 peptidase S1 and S6 chymotrypsin/Hap [Stackebrandtia nassauensis DSM 44728]
MRRKFALTAAAVVVAVAALGVGGMAYADREYGSGNGDDASTKIIGGQPASEEYKFHASMQYKEPGERPNPQRCGGSLIAPEWVLTAAHCVSKVEDGALLNPADYHIRIGSNDNLAGEQIEIESFTTHPYWATDNESVADIALIKLKTAAKEKPVAMSGHPSGDKPIRIIGWGRTDRDDPNSISQQAQELDTTLLNFDDCKFGEPGFDISPGDLCVDTPDGKAGPCSGDSGSPAMHKVGDQWRIFGITSRGGGDKCLSTPEVYTNIDWWSDWIAETTG